MEILKEKVNSLCLEEQVTTEILKEKMNSLCQEQGSEEVSRIIEEFVPIEGFVSFRKARDADFDELKLFISEVFGHIDDGVHLNCLNTVTKYILRNARTIVALPLEENEDHELKKEPSPIVLYAALSYIDLKADLCSPLKDYILNLTQMYASDDFKSKVALLNVKNDLTLIFGDRKEFCTPEICKLLQDCLRSRKDFVNNGDHFFYVAKIFKVKQISSTNTKGEELIVWMNSEDKKFADQASDYFEYPVNPKIVSGLPDGFWSFGPDKWNPDDYETAVPWRRVFLIKFDTLNTILKNLEEVF